MGNEIEMRFFIDDPEKTLGTRPFWAAVYPINWSQAPRELELAHLQGMHDEMLRQLYLTENRMRELEVAIYHEKHAQLARAVREVAVYHEDEQLNPVVAAIIKDR